MSIFKSAEEFESFLESQQTALTDVAPAPSSKAPRSLLQAWGAVFGLAAPVLLLFCIGAFLWANTRDSTTSSMDPSDRILSWVAWFGGREYNPKNNPFSSKHEFKMPQVEPIDWEEYGRKNEEVLRSNRERLSRQFEKYHGNQQRAAHGN